MTEGKWQNSQTGVEVGVNTILGSPRAWVNRAVGSKYQDLGISESSLHPTQLTVAGIWARPRLAFDTGSAPAIYRYFRLPADFFTRSRDRSMRSMIGVSMAVANDKILSTRQRMLQAGAEWTWWSWPGEIVRSYYTPVTARTDIDHAELYQLFDQGLAAADVAEQQSLSIASVRYVYEKWQSGKPAQRLGRRPTVNHRSITEDLRTGLYGMQEIADRNGTTRMTVWKIKRQQGITV